MATDTPERVPVAIKPVSGWSNHAFLGHDRAPIVVLTNLFRWVAVLFTVTTKPDIVKVGQVGMVSITIVMETDCVVNTAGGVLVFY